MSIDYRGSTVLITGASSGLGAEFARQLAARGAHLVLVARRKDRLEALKSELEAAHAIEATVVAADLTAPDAASALAAELERLALPIHSLINNAGFGTHNAFSDEDAVQIHNEVTLNVTALVDLTRQFWPRLVQQGTGVLVNVASAAAFQPIPKMAIYGATKAFVLSFTEALWYEAMGSGLKVLAFCPAATETEFFDTSGPGARVGKAAAADDVVRLALKTLDRRNPPPSVVHGFATRAQIFGERLISRRLLVIAAGKVAGN
ncbi:MAG TPA: SDR family oxidoreductase [Galbitalea sp.]|nr:SDR family oxidoreductase [Galbitalea sp.]